jgi:hypothetical protein
MTIFTINNENIIDGELSQETLRQLNEDPKSFTDIIFENCDNLESLPDLSNLSNLERLSVINCNKLQEVLTLADLENLQELEIKNCDNLKSIPDLSYLLSLEKLSVDNCKSLQKISSLTCLRNLQELEIENCDNLESLKFPKESLTDIKILQCNKIKSIDLKNSQCLTSLHLEGLANLETLELSSEKDKINIGLYNITILNCEKLRSISDLSIHIPSLKNINLGNLKSLESFTDLSASTFLNLTIANSHKLEKIFESLLDNHKIKINYATDIYIIDGKPAIKHEGAEEQEEQSLTKKRKIIKQEDVEEKEEQSSTEEGKPSASVSQGKYKEPKKRSSSQINP